MSVLTLADRLELKINLAEISSLIYLRTGELSKIPSRRRKESTPVRRPQTRMTRNGWAGGVEGEGARIVIKVIVW